MGAWITRKRFRGGYRYWGGWERRHGWVTSPLDARVFKTRAKARGTCIKGEVPVELFKELPLWGRRVAARERKAKKQKEGAG